MSRQLQSYTTPLVVKSPTRSYDPADLLTIGEVATLLGLNQSTLRGRIARSNLRVGQRQGHWRLKWRRTYYSRADVERIREALL